MNKNATDWKIVPIRIYPEEIIDLSGQVAMSSEDDPVIGVRQHLESSQHIEASTGADANEPPG